MHRHLFHTWATLTNKTRVAHVWNKCLCIDGSVDYHAWNDTEPTKVLPIMEEMGDGAVPRGLNILTILPRKVWNLEFFLM